MKGFCKAGREGPCGLRQGRNDSGTGFARLPQSHHSRRLLSFLGKYTLNAPDVCQERTHAAPLTHCTTEPAVPPSYPAPAPSRTGNRRGNPDLGRAPAIRGKLRCRMHGGRSTGPRTPEGMARLRAARTIHGADRAQTRAHNRYGRTLLRRDQVGNAALLCLDRLPPDFSARLWQMPPELLPPPWPTGGLTPARDRAVLRTEAATLAPWRAAIAQAGFSGLAGRAPAAIAGQSCAQAEPTHQNVPPRRLGHPHVPFLYLTNYHHL